jgi:hypothetical protein
LDQVVPNVAVQTEEFPGKVTTHLQIQRHSQLGDDRSRLGDLVVNGLLTQAEIVDIEPIHGPLDSNHRTIEQHLNDTLL